MEGRTRLHGAETVRGMKTVLLAALLASAALRPAAAQVIADVQVTPDRLELPAGEATRLFAAAYDPQGRIISGAAITYLSSDSSIAAVSRDGQVTGRLAGTTMVEAVAGGRRDTSLVTVTSADDPAVAQSPASAVAVSSILLEPAALALLPLEPARLIAHISTADSSTPPIVPLIWRSGDTRIAAVDHDGVVVGIGPGVTTITATASNGVSGTVAVVVDTAVFTTLARTVLALGAIDTLHAIVPSQDGRQLTAGLTWVSEDTAVAHVSPGGVVRGASPGQTGIVVRGFGMTGRIQVVVRPPIAKVVAVPAADGGPLNLAITAARRFDVKAVDAAGNLVEDLPVTFAVGDTTVAEFVRETGTLTGRRVGNTTLTARIEGADSVVWTVNVVPVMVSVERQRLALRVGDRVQLASRLLDPDGAVVPGVSGPVTWTSARPSVATVSAGAISALALGHTLVRAATPWGTADSVEVYVNGDLLLSSDRAARSGVGIYTIQLAEPGVFVPVLADTSTNLDAAYSPDRTRIAFSSNRSGSFDVWLMNADGSALTRLTTESGDETEPSWTPDGTHILYTASHDGQTQIATIGVDGSDARELTSTPGGNVSPAVSPDGRVIAFASARAGNYEIFEMGIDGSGVRRITATPQRDQSPQFFPNGDLLYASDRPKGGTQIIRQSGTSRKVLAETEDAVLALSLSPDGRRYLYLAGKRVARGGSQVDYRLISQRTDAVPEAITIPLGAGEQAATPSF